MTIQSRDGVVVTLRNVDTKVETPIGDYRVSSIMLTMADPEGGLPWGFVFSDNNGRDNVWRHLADKNTLSIDPLSQIQFGLDSPDDAPAGESVQVRPTLHTGDGLLIERAYRGVFHSFASGCQGHTVLTDSDGTVLSTAASGFA